MNIEPLESRIAPASVFVTYTDLDGDLVKITASKPGATAPPLNAADLNFIGGGTSGQLKVLALNDAGFDGAAIVFTVSKKPGGDGLAHVGFVLAVGVDLDRVVIKGDLGTIAVGDGTTANDPGLNLLQVRSMGTLGLVTQDGAGSLNSTVSGKLGALKVAGDFTDASLTVTGMSAAEGLLGSVFIGGDLVGGADTGSGRISGGTLGNVQIGGDLIGGAGNSGGNIVSVTTMGNVQIGGDLIGGAGNSSGGVFSNDAMGNVRIRGDLTGGASDFSGLVASGSSMGSVRIGGDLTGGAGGSSGGVESAGAMGNVQIGGDLAGGAGNGSGDVRSGGTLGSVQIGGDLTGGAGGSSGRVTSTGAMGSVRIGGDLVGGSVTGMASLTDSGAILSFGRIAGVTIGGSLIAGINGGTGTIFRCGSIMAADDIGPVKIGGSILGSTTNPALIIAQGQSVKPVTGFDTAIASLTVGGDVRLAKILAGFNTFQAPVNADAAIGAVSVGRDWAASSLVAGAADTGADGFGINDALQTMNDTVLVARIASITIKGDATGSLAAGDHFGFVAQQIDKLKIGARTFTLVPGPSSPADNFLLPFTDDVHLLEV